MSGIPQFYFVDKQGGKQLILSKKTKIKMRNVLLREETLKSKCETLKW